MKKNCLLLVTKINISSHKSRCRFREINFSFYRLIENQFGYDKEISSYIGCPLIYLMSIEMHFQPFC